MMRTGKTQASLQILVEQLDKGNSVFVAGMKDPKEYTERLFKEHGLVVETNPHYVTKNTETILEDVPPYRVWETKYEPQLTGYEFKKI